MNTYIQRKLLEKHICRFNDGERNCDCYIAGMTDYHNHIVEKIYNAPNDKINCLKQHIAGESIWLSKRDILNILQDTNPKE